MQRFDSVTGLALTNLQPWLVEVVAPCALTDAAQLDIADIRTVVGIGITGNGTNQIGLGVDGGRVRLMAGIAALDGDDVATGIGNAAAMRHRCDAAYLVGRDVVIVTGVVDVAAVAALAVLGHRFGRNMVRRGFVAVAAGSEIGEDVTAGGISNQGVAVKAGITLGVDQVVVPGDKDSVADMAAETLVTGKSCEFGVIYPKFLWNWWWDSPDGSDSPEYEEHDGCYDGYDSLFHSFRSFMV